MTVVTVPSGDVIIIAWVTRQATVGDWDDACRFSMMENMSLWEQHGLHASRQHVIETEVSPCDHTGLVFSYK